MGGGLGDLKLRHSGFFVIRMPLCSIDELVRWGEGTRAAAALELGDQALAEAVAADRQLLATRLRETARDPRMREALFVASPSLDEAVTAWLDGSAKDPGNVVGIVTRYFSRLTSRATPFGLFAATQVGTVQPGAALRCTPQPTFLRHTRLDMEYVSALAEALERRPETRARLRFAPNTSLYQRAGQLRYIEARIDPVTRDRQNDLVAIEATDAMREVLRLAEGGATPATLARGLVDTRPALSPARAAEFVEALIESRVLVSQLVPAVTGPNPLDDLIATLAQLPDETATTATLADVRDAIAALDRDGLGLEADRYRAIAARLEALPAPVELRRLFHVDLYRRAEASIGEQVVAELSGAVETLSRIAATAPPPALARFRERFTERYEQRMVPLVEALDEDLGVGYPAAENLSADPTPLLEGIELGAGAGEAAGTFGPAEAWKLRRLHEVLAAESAGAPLVWSLDARDLEVLAQPAAPLPGAFVAMAVLAAPSAEAVERGDYALVMKGVSGPSGARLFGRFCHGEPALRAQVEAHLRAEEARRPEAIFAEVVHLPQGRLGNILCRPALRAYEIPYLARPGVDGAHTIAITDLLVSVEGGRVVLRSRRLGREILPRLTSAHAVSAADLPLYRFLTALQSQDGVPALDWSWGPLATAPRLPRVTVGRVVLSLARWTLPASALAGLLGARGAARFRAATELRRRHRLPRWLSVGERDQRLALDLDNVLHVDTLAELARDRAELEVLELYPPPQDCCVAGPDGRYTHEIAVPFVRSDAAPAAAARTEESGPVARTFAPGSEWLTVKCYCGPSGVDRLLREVVAPLVKESEIERWFFLRYGDPAWHVRLRFQGPRDELYGRLLPRLHDRLAPLLATGLVGRVQLDTYQRELERYGGPEAMPLVEEVFHHDSEAALSIVELLDGDEGGDARWRLALRGCHDLLVDFGLELDQRLALVTDLRERFGREHAVDVKVERQLGQRYRGERQAITRLLSAPGDDHPLAAGLAILARRSAALAPVVARLRALEERRELTQSRPDLLASLLHMHANRMLLAQQRPQELVINDFLVRHYTSERARARGPRTG